MALSNLSEIRLATCHHDLQRVVRLAAERMHIAVLCGHRGEADQEAAYKAGNSPLRYPHSLHNQKPSRAIDCCPLPVDFLNHAAFKAMGAVLEQAAADLGVSVRWGGRFKRQDLPHLELAPDA